MTRPSGWRPKCVSIPNIRSPSKWTGPRGTNSVRWATPYRPHEKDALEGWLHGQVCGGRVSLQSAQRAIARDWLAAWRKANLESKGVE
jgi:hypothetical protein